jgi:hypothetical protein
VSDERCLPTSADGEIPHAYDRSRKLADSKKAAFIKFVAQADGGTIQPRGRHGHRQE